jgi:hypothetical protein
MLLRPQRTIGYIYLSMTDKTFRVCTTRLVRHKLVAEAASDPKQKVDEPQRIRNDSAILAGNSCKTPCANPLENSIDGLGLTTMIAINYGAVRY